MIMEIIPVTIKIAQPTKLLISRPQQAELSTQIIVNLQQVQQLLGNDPSGGHPPTRRVTFVPFPRISISCHVRGKRTP